MDAGTVELLGRNRLTGELLRAGLEVAFPIRDRGIDLIAYADLETRVKTFIARPIQMKAASSMTFGVDRKYSKFPNLIIAYVWYVDDPQKTCTFGLSFADAVQVAEKMGWTSTESWQRGAYVTTKPSKILRELLSPYAMTPRKWWEIITGTSYVEG